MDAAQHSLLLAAAAQKKVFIISWKLPANTRKRIHRRRKNEKDSKTLNGVPKNVNFVGFLSGQDLDEFYRNTYALIFPSICFEGYPNTLVRAMAYGKPVVASRIGAIPQIVGDGVHGFTSSPVMWAIW